MAYRRLSIGEREEISRGLASGLGIIEIAARLARSPSTVSREVAGFEGEWRGYRAHVAQGRAARRASGRRKGRRKMLASAKLERLVRRRLLSGWSPDQIAKSLRMRYPDRTDMRVSHETIYAYLYVLPRGELKRRLIAGLRQERKYRRKRKPGTHAEKRGRIADMLSIEERPAEVADRTVPGHWEGDLIIGRHKRTAIGTLVERATRFAILVPLKAKDAASVRKAFAREVKRLPRQLAKTLTYDQGSEMKQHKLFTEETSMQVYFAHPSSPWERGTNENTNGLVRQFFPKGTDFSAVTVRQIKRVQRLLNERPRMTLGYRTPYEKFNELVALET